MKRTTVFSRTKPSKWLILLIVVPISLVGAYLLLMLWEESVEQTSITFVAHYRDPLSITQLFEEADAVIIGEVGPILANAYPNELSRSEYSQEEWDILNSDGFARSSRVAFFEIGVLEEIKGDVPDPVIYLYEDVDYYIDTDYPKISEGGTLMLVLYEKKEDTYSHLFELIYHGASNQGIFDVDGNRVFPRNPDTFKDTPESFFVRELTPYFELDKLRVALGDK